MPVPFILPVESFLDPVYAASIWPESVTNNAAFRQQIEKRRELDKRFNDVLDSLPRPDTPLEVAIDQGRVTPEQAAELYTSLSGLLADQDYRRLVLYFPFELLPNKAWHPFKRELQQALDQFEQAYMEAWESLLSVHDVRANFVDGDVLEAEQRIGELPRVVKAAHLIPALVQRGLMRAEDAIALIEENDDQTLKDSVADTLPVLADLGLLSEKEMEAMKKSKDQLVRSMARIIVSGKKPGGKEQRVERAPRAITLSLIQNTLDRELSRIATQDYGEITKKRKEWLQQKGRQEAIGAAADDICPEIIQGRLPDKVVTSLLSSNAKTASRQALVEGIRKAVESASPGRAQALYALYAKALLALWEIANPEVQETLLQTFHRLYRLGIIDRKQLEELNIAFPKLAGPFSENLGLMKEEMDDIKRMVASIESNPELSQLIYPIVLVFGSRLNGYGTQSADIDLSVFVKPGTAFDKQPRLKTLLKEAFVNKDIRGDEIIEFWLEEKEDRLEISDSLGPDEVLGESYWTHILFGAAWLGNESAIAGIVEKLLVPYLYDTDREIQGCNARRLYLGDLEQSTQQYRLMHKGYERFYPPYGGIQARHADEIDGKSAFWDSGYRQLATRLFISRVFLPKITTSQK